MSAIRVAISRSRAEQLKALRAGLMGQLFPTLSSGTIPPTTDDPQSWAYIFASDLASSFKRYAGNQQTAYDNGAVQSSPTSAANLLERKVERAIAQVLGRSPGRGGTNFVNALKAAFPDTAKGAGSALTLASTSALAETANTHEPIGGLMGHLSTQQATLYRQVSIIVVDALKALEGAKSFVPEADTDRVEALRSLIRTQLKSIVEEFGRTDAPRAERVQSQLRSLKESVTEFGSRAHLNQIAYAATVDDEENVARYDLLKNYVDFLSTAWSHYQQNKTQRSYSLSLRIDRAKVWLPILAQANIDFSNALDSVGLMASERRSDASRFTRLNVPAFTLAYDQPAQAAAGEEGSETTTVPRQSMLAATTEEVQPRSWLPDITVHDLIEWLDQFANFEAPSALDSVYGIDFVTDQADRLFWTVAPIVGYLKTTNSSTSSQAPLGQILSNERVSWALDNVLGQLQVLADLAV
jgi:hypothetical protein